MQKKEVVTVDKNEFVIEFNSNEEVQEMLDGIVASVGEAIMADEERTSILSPLKLQQMQFAYGVLKYLIKGTGAQLTYSLNEPFKSMGSISVEGKTLSFTNAEWFSRAAEFASSTEIYPLSNGKIRMTMTFHGLVNPIN